MNANDYMDALAKTIMETVDKFALEKRAENNKKHFKETWITNEIKNAIVKRKSGFKIPRKRNANDTKMHVITLPFYSEKKKKTKISKNWGKIQHPNKSTKR